MRLDRLARDEALQLIAELAAKYPRLARASEKEREDLYEITQGNPLFIRWIAGSWGGQARSAAPSPMPAPSLIKPPKAMTRSNTSSATCWRPSPPTRRKSSPRSTYFTLPAKLKWIADMTALPARAAETALEDLTDRSILTSDLSAQTYFLPPLTAKFIRTRRPEAVTQTGDALTDRAYAIAMQYGGYSKDYEKFPILDAEWDFISAALPRLLTGDNDRLQTVCRQLHRFLDFTGRWDDLLWLNEQAEACALAINDKEDAGWRAYQSGRAYRFRNQPAEVLSCAARAAEHWDNNYPHNKTFAIRLRGHGYQLGKDYPAAIAAYREALEIWRSISPESDIVSMVLNDLGNAELSSKDYTAAERDFREAVRLAKINKNNERIATHTGNLAGLALDREQWAEAESLAREALALAEKVGRQELIASDCDRLAEALLKQNRDLDEALSMSRRAVEIYTRLRSSRLQSAQETLEEIEKAMSGQ